MAFKQDIFYKYSPLSTQVLENLCCDKLYFSPPSDFNDPFDCNPSFVCDTDITDLKNLLRFLIERRVFSQVCNRLIDCKVSEKSAKRFAEKQAKLEANHEIENLEYNAADPRYEDEIESTEEKLLLEDIGREMKCFYPYGISFFSDSYENLLLWSHYAKDNNGLYVGYRIDRDPIPKLKKVKYDNDRVIKTSLLVSAYIENDNDSQIILDEKILFTKGRSWEYENEWRLTGQIGLRESPLLMQEVIFSLRCPSSFKHMLVSSLSSRDNKILFFEMYEDVNKYALKRRSLDIEELKLYYPRTAKSNNELFA